MHEPDDLVIVRDLKFEISKNATRHWLGGDLYKTALIDCFAVFFPVGERFFIRTLRHYVPIVDDDRLEREVDGYAIQEGLHTREHEEYNTAMRALGYDVDWMEGNLTRFVREELTDPLERLAMTCAMEQVTTALAIATLRKPKRFANAQGAYRRLWFWHALEELEHSTAGIHVLRAVTSNLSAWQRYRIRTGAMTRWLGWLMHHLVLNMQSYTKHDARPSKWQFWLGFLRVLLVNPGYGRASFLMIMSYYLPWFDPDRQLDRALVKRGRDLLDHELGGYDGGKPLSFPAE
jgi:predicted metal-dependent hydrolase